MYFRQITQNNSQIFFLICAIFAIYFGFLYFWWQIKKEVVHVTKIKVGRENLLKSYINGITKKDNEILCDIERIPEDLVSSTDFPFYSFNEIKKYKQFIGIRIWPPFSLLTVTTLFFITLII